MCEDEPGGFCRHSDKKYTIYLDEMDYITATENCETLGIFYAESQAETEFLLKEASTHHT